jgi:Tol biopolymer transport system component/DNA-binding winged helix-turn-helix (wHTH) protein
VRARFGHYEVDLSSGDLRRSGVSVRIQEQPLQLLRLLLEADGRVVTREQMRGVLWPEDTFVDFEHGVNTAVKKLRQTLEDSVEDPQFIETLPKFGYRFMVPVTWVDDGTHRSTPLLMSVPGPAPTDPWWKKNAKVAVAAAVVIVSGAAVLAYFWAQPPAVPRVNNYVQLTHDGHAKWLVATDGSRIYLGVGTYGLQSIAEISVGGGGEPKPKPTPPGTNMVPLDLSPDGSQLLVVDGQGEPYHGRFWSLPVLGGAPHRLGDTEGRSGSWSPDGKLLAYSAGSDLFLAKADGTEGRKLAMMKVPTKIDFIAWSPDGSRLRFQAAERFTDPPMLWEVSTKDGEPHRLLPGWNNLPEEECCGKWTADGRYFVFSSRHQIWALPRKGNFLHANPKPIQLTASPMSLTSPMPSKDGKKLFVVGQTYRGELVRYEPKSSRFLPFLGGISAEYLDFSKDGQWVAYVSYPEGILWRSKVDGSERLQLTYLPGYSLMPRWSPDSKQIVFIEIPADKSARIYEVSAEGGTPRQLMPDDPSQQSDPNWSPDGSKIVFGGAGGDPASTVRVLDLTTRQVSTLTGSQGFFSPRWSPDGRYLVAMTVDSGTLYLWDFQTEKWTDLGSVGGFPSWSKDGQYVYVFGANATYAVLRIRISDHKVEQVADFKALATTGRYGGSLALAPDDSLLLLRDVGTQDVYALDWEVP